MVRVPARNCNAFVGNLCTINLSCSLWFRYPWSLKDTHSIPPAWFALTPPGEGPTSRPKPFTLTSLKRLSLLCQNLNSTSGETRLRSFYWLKSIHIFIFSQLHTFTSWDDYHRRLLTVQMPHLSGGPPCSIVGSSIRPQMRCLKHSPTLPQMKHLCPIEDEKVQPGGHTPRTGLLLIL